MKSLLRMLNVLSAFLLFIACSHAQVHNEYDGLDPALTIGYLKIPAANVGGIGGTFESSSLYLRCAIPVIGDPSSSSARMPGFRLLINGVGSRTYSDLGALARTEIFYDLRAGVTGVLVSESRNIYRLSTLIGVSEENSTVQKPRLRYTMSGSGTHHLSQDFSLRYGLAFTYLYGDGKLLPMLGCQWRFADQWTAGFVLPFTAGVSYRLDRNSLFRISLSPAGDKMRFENGNSFPGAAGIIDMKMTQAKLSAEAQLRISELFGLRGELGFLAARNISFLDGKIALQSGNVDPTGFLSVGLSFHFGDSFFPEDVP